MTTHQQQHHNIKPLCKLQCADSTFLGYICTYTSLSDIHKYRNDLINFHHPKAAHVPYATSIINLSSDDDNVNVDKDSSGGYQQVTKTSSVTSEGYHDDNEPSQANIGLTLLNELTRYKRILRRQSTIRIRGGSSQMYDDDAENHDSSIDEKENEEDTCALTNPPTTTNSSHPPIATSIIIVRYFTSKLLGVTCGRLTSIYARTARLALHRHMNGVDKPYIERFTFSSSGSSRSGEEKEESEEKNIYGLGAGDTELILNVVPPTINNNTDVNSSNTTYDREGRPLPDPHASSRGIVQALLSELEFEGMVGSKNELLPRLQNLQADLPTINQDEKNSIIPIYRYPGNYSGTEWPTHSWSTTSLTIKQAVEEALQPLYIQSMNHCVTNLYRLGPDRIDHHSDKDLDLNRFGVIVSISLGCTRVMELKDRLYPHDVTRIELPSNSMFVLGPYTNARFTHAVLPKKVTFSESNLVSLAGEDEDTKKASSLNARCSIEGGGRISLTFRDVRTFLDIKTQRLFGQGVSSSVELPTIVIDEDTGVIKNESLAEVVHITRDQDTKDKSTALVIALGLGTAVGYVSSKSSSSGERRRETKSDTTLALLVRNVSTAIISASASYWYLQRARRRMRQFREEKEARVFFSKKSASGNKY